MNDERLDDYLRGLDEEDAAADWRPEGGYALSWDEWNARRVAAGLPAGTLAEYIQAIRLGDEDVQQGS